MKRKWILIELLCLSLSAFLAVYIGFNVEQSGFELLWILPVTFACCFHVLLKCVLTSKNTLFYYVFIAAAMVRYVVGPFLHVYTGEYIDRYAKSIPASDTLTKAICLMAYELLVCTVFLWFMMKREKKQEIRGGKMHVRHIIMPKRTWLYVLFVVVTGVMMVMFPDALMYFSFFTFSSLASVDMLSTFGLMTQITIMLMITAKYLVFIMVIGYLHKKYERARTYKALIEFCAYIFALLCGVTYYGSNRIQFLINLICSIYIFFLLFSKNRKKYFLVSALCGVVVLLYMTEQRGYGDNYYYESGFKKTLFSLNQMIMEYLGGVDHVAIAIEMRDNYADYRSIGQLIRDFMVPVVGINKILGFHNGMIANNLFNFQFFAHTNNVTQILPSIGHGFFYLGFLLAPMVDVFQLWIVLRLIKIHNTKQQIELIFLINIVIIRLGLMFGHNISQQMNGFSMQLMLPMIVYFFNRVLILKKEG